MYIYIYISESIIYIYIYIYIYILRERERGVTFISILFNILKIIKILHFDAITKFCHILRGRETNLETDENIDMPM